MTQGRRRRDIKQPFTRPGRGSRTSNATTAIARIKYADKRRSKNTHQRTTQERRRRQRWRNPGQLSARRWVRLVHPTVVHPSPDSVVEPTYWLDQPFLWYALRCIEGLRPYVPASGDEREGVDWSGKRVAPTALSALGRTVFWVAVAVAREYTTSPQAPRGCARLLSNNAMSHRNQASGVR